MFRQFLILACILVICFYSVGCRDKKNHAIDSISKSNIYAAHDNPRDSIITKQWKNYKELVNVFSTTEIVKLCEHSNPIVRAYAFTHLADTKYHDIYKILLDHLHDTSSLVSINGCVTKTQSVSDIYLEQVKYDYIYDIALGIARWKDLYFSKNQYDVIDSILLYGHEIKERDITGALKYKSREKLLHRLSALPQYHNRILEIASAGVYEVLPVLAQYKSLSDTGFLKKILSSESNGQKSWVNPITLQTSILNAITLFPHDCFYPTLKRKIVKVIENQTASNELETAALCFAIAQYPTDETKNLLIKISKKVNNLSLDIIQYSLKQYTTKDIGILIRDIFNAERS